MKQGQTLKAPDGYQICLYPLADMNLSQTYGSGTFSHCCGKPIDDAHSDGTPVFAPCDCTRIAMFTDFSLGHTYFFKSNNKVWTPTGLKYVYFAFTHMTNLYDSSPVVKSYKQGEMVYSCGVSGYVGAHVHIDTSSSEFTNFINSGLTCVGMSRACYMPPNAVSPDTIFYVNDTTLTNTGGLGWKTYNGGIPGGSSGKPYPATWVINKTETIYSNPEIFSWNSDSAKTNVLKVCEYFDKLGWSITAIAGMIGNMSVECEMNVNTWERPGDSSSGYGLTQWTPGNKIIEYIKSLGMISQSNTFGDIMCKRIKEECDGVYEQWIATEKYPQSFKEYSTSNLSIDDSVECFMRNYERAGVEKLSTRVERAKYYFPILQEYYGGGTYSSQSTFKIWMMLKRRPYVKTFKR